MPIRDLRSAPSGTEFRPDVAIIGGGPVGLTIAREFANSRCRVLIIESGGADFEAAQQTLNAVVNVGEPVVRDGVESPGRGYNGSLEWLNDIPLSSCATGCSAAARIPGSANARASTKSTWSAGPGCRSPVGR
ncbi:hypothetical protein [Ensifer canadensis]|uniref:hypothetical protein n=1 Tax=Ensifer canadensis TaxID=555315 RepID=UPI0035E3D77A